MSKNNNCIFCKIIDGKIDADVTYEDKDVVTFSDVNPQAPVHILVVPREHIKNLNRAGEDITGRLVNTAKKIAVKKDIDKSGYRIVINCNRDGGQEVDHLHVHLLGGRKMSGPLG
ncbi:MAG: histidine triad nucleotide-binding protein [Elusimicrobiota bacterium]